ncbi:bifunctional transcriptional activator/DNA repair enzyme AdaA [Streptomyces sp. NPDC013978]|uniref:bifunctional transcriptional activator/DNA repair enzyme AdaA n=1 Tax=Streptomyces sp. NPDC013978 TaxID=3364869 RepID=UPI0037034454
MSRARPRSHARTTPPPAAGSRQRHLDDESRWAAVAGRDADADEAFCYGVLTTGVYSRPSCGARTPDRGNTVFFANPQEARRAGFRPCRRCRPDAGRTPSAAEQAVLHACRSLEQPGLMSLDALAAPSGFSRFHFHRLFTATIGVTPRVYALACRAEHVRQALTRTSTVTEAIYQSGFNSTGTFYTLTRDLLGMTPTEFRKGGWGVPIRYAVVAHERGSLLVGATSAGVCSVLAGQDGDVLVGCLRARYSAAPAVTADPGLAHRLARAVQRIRPRVGTALPPDIRNRAIEGGLRKTLSPPVRTR